jgi:hypothetical protein
VIYFGCIPRICEKVIYIGKAFQEYVKGDLILRGIPRKCERVIFLKCLSLANQWKR